VGQPLQELAHVNGGAMQIKKPFRDHGNRDDAANQDGPHQQPALLEVFDHGPPSSAFWASSQARAGGRQCDLTTSEHQSMAQLVFNRRKQRERRLLSFSEVEGRSSASPASQSSALQASPSAGGRIFCFFVTFCLVRYFRFVGDGLGATVWPRSFPAPS